jgi:signal transduction histidine kinase
MNFANRGEMPLSVRLTLIMTSLMVGAVLVVTLLSIQREQETFRSELQQQAQLLLGALVVATGDALYLLDADFLEDVMEELPVSASGIVGRVYDPRGHVIADASRDNLVFGVEVDPFGQQLVMTEGYVFDWQVDRLVAGKAARFGRQLLGAVSIEISTLPLLTKVEVARNQGLLAAVGTAIIGMVVALLFSRSITEPLTVLQNATQRIGSDLSYRIPIERQDEFGRVAQAFNAMSQRLYEREQELARRNELLVNEVAERKRAEQQALESSRLKSEFLSTMSHELRTPLNAIRGFTSIMLEGMGGEIDAEARHMIERVSANGERLLGLINDILDIAKIEAGRMELVTENLKPHQLVEHWQSQMSVLAAQRGLAFDVQVDPNLPEIIQGDSARITQIAINLLSNAFKFTKEGKVSLEVRNGASDRWQIVVGDTGIGIPPHALSYIFDEFRQVDGSSKRAYGGTGLGLAIVRNLCRIMGGKIEVTSELGKGSVFTVTLPLVTVPQSEAIAVQ